MSSVEDYMNAKMVTRDSKASMLELAKVMVDWNISSVAITEEQNNKKVVGILTERDIVKSIAKGVQPDGITADSLMSSHIFSIRKDQPIEKGSSSNDKKQSEASSGGGSRCRQWSNRNNYCDRCG